MTEWRNIRAVLIRIGGYFSLMMVGYVGHALQTGCWS
jgi:hypothetical protein